jgi:hypothetical protein
LFLVKKITPWFFSAQVYRVVVIKIDKEIKLRLCIGGAENNFVLFNEKNFWPLYVSFSSFTSTFDND